MMVENIHPKKKWRKIAIALLVSTVAIVALVIIFISPLTKYLVEKYDIKFLGREVKMDWAYVNPFTGYIHLDNLKIYEAKKDTVFFSASGISVNFAMLKLFSKTYEISSLTIDKSKGNIIRTKNIFNFNDLILKFSASDSIPKKNKNPLHFNILNININNSEFYFSEPSTPINYSFLKVNFSSDGKYWNSDTINGKLSLISGIGSGVIKANFLINAQTLDYNFAALVTDFNLNVTKQYLKDLADYGNISGKLNADVKATGNFKNKENIDGKGYVIINDFHFGKDSLNDFVSYKKLTVAFKQIAPTIKKYLIDTVRLDNPIFKYEKYDDLDNIQNMFGKNGSKVKAARNNPEKFNLIITISEYIQTIFKNFLKSDYKINSLAVVDGNIIFNDFSPNEKFSASLSPFNVRADSVDNKKKLVNIYLTSGIKPYGTMSVTLSANPNSIKDFDVSYELRKIPITQFNPYLISYTSFPLNRGTVELFGNWHVRNDMIDSKNHLIIIDPRVGKRIRKNDSNWLPLRFMMFFVRERGNVIDYEIPITGYLKDPKFHFRDAIIDAIQNIFVKPVTAPYRFEVKNTEIEVEKSLSLVWYMRQTILISSQEKFLAKISDFLKDNPESNIMIQPMTFDDKEKENILFFEAKKKYYLLNKEKNKNSMTEDDSLAIDKIAAKDNSFIKFLDKQINDTLLFTMQEKCYRLVGENLVNNEFEKLVKRRSKVVMDYFKQEKTNAQVKIASNKNEIPFKGFSYFKINYNGDFPNYLLEANKQLNEFNNNAPRAKYKKFRNK